MGEMRGSGVEVEARYHVMARVDSELYYSADLFCGLFELVEEGSVELRFKPCFSRSPTESFCTVLEVTDRWSNERRVLAFDWRDNADILCERKLAECDLYFKRNYIPEVTESRCQGQHRHKLRPAGLSCSVRARRERPLWVQWLSGVWSQEKPLMARSLRATYANVRRILVRNPRMVSQTLRKQDLLCPTIEGARNAVFWRAIAYDPRWSNNYQDTHETMEARAHVLWALKRELGDQFVGGFMPGPYAGEMYADLVMHGPSDRQSYINMIRAHRIAIYARGVRNSPAFKLAEYLANSRCILAEPIATRLPRDLVDGRELIYWRDTDDLIAKCRQLLSDVKLQRRLSENARRYYEEQVDPPRQIQRFFQEAFENAKTDRSITAAEPAIAS